MKIGKLLGLILAVLFFSMIQVQAETWSAGPALIPVSYTHLRAHETV